MGIVERIETKQRFCDLLEETSANFEFESDDEEMLKEIKSNLKEMIELVDNLLEENKGE